MEIFKQVMALVTLIVIPFTIGMFHSELTQRLDVFLMFSTPCLAISLLFIMRDELKSKRIKDSLEVFVGVVLFALLVAGVLISALFIISYFIHFLSK